MDSKLIEKFLTLKANTQFIGVFSSDTLPIISKYPCSLVVNTDIHTKPGEHWLAIHFDGKKNAYYFDSFGLPPTIKSIIKFLKMNSVSVRYNRKTLQGFSRVCGLYCILFIIYRARNKSVKKFLNQFGNNVEANDRKIGKLVKRLKW